jgi:two-component system KDP operon response regulator KdpE
MMSRRILLVEDDHDLVATLREVLGQEGYDVLTAPSGEAAVSVARQAHPELALVDLHIEGAVTGPELVASLRREMPQGARIHLLSGERDLSRRAREAGADGCLEKPFGVDALLAVIEGALKAIGAMAPDAPLVP